MKIVAIVDSHGPDANAAYLVDCVTEGAMTMSTNMITLHYLNKLPLFLDATPKDADSLDSIVDDFSPIEQEILGAELIIVGADIDNNSSCKLIDKFFERISCRHKPLKLDGKKLVCVLVANQDTADFRYNMDKYLSDIKEKKMDVVDTLCFFDDNGRINAKDNLEVKKEAQRIGLQFRNTFRTSQTAKKN